LDDFSANEKHFNINELKGVDRAIISLVQSTIRESNESFEKFDYAKAKSVWVEFFMNEVADNYLEIVKQRLWQKEDNYKSAQTTLYYILFQCVKGIAPIMPFITESVYQRFFKEFENVESVHLQSYPLPDTNLEDKENEECYHHFTTILRKVRKYKAEKQISMKEPLSMLTIYCDSSLQNFIENNIEDLRNVTNTPNILIENGEFNISIE
jgi:valyl-tRNA synthetase